MKFDYVHCEGRTDGEDPLKFLEQKKLVNPHSLHPNIKCHIKIADMIDKFILW